MTTDYTPDNTRSSMAVIGLLAAGVTLVALLLGLSDKPDISAIGVAITADEMAEFASEFDSQQAFDAAAATQAALRDDATFSVPAEPSDSASETASTDAVAATDAGAGLSNESTAIGTSTGGENGGTGGTADASTEPAPSVAGSTADETTDETAGADGFDKESSDPAAAVDVTATAGASETIAVTPIPLETATAEPTPEIAAAVDTDALLDNGAASSVALEGDELESLTATRVSPGTIAGQFFTRPDEDEGAVVARNELSITLNEDGTGSLAAVLDMTLVDATQVLISMSGPIRWSNDTPQVFSELNGTFTLNSQIDADDLASDTAEVTISSLASGSGSLCPDTCYGFTFPPQTGF